MGDDPNQDLPVKEVALSSVQSSLAGSARQLGPCRAAGGPHEDQYLSLRQENDELKVRLHAQNDKMKRMSTKLVRLMSERKRALDGGPSTRRALELRAALEEQTARVDELQAANSQLRERAAVLQLQLAEQTRARAGIPGFLRSPRRGKPPSAGSAAESRPSVKSADPPDSGRDAEVQRLHNHVALLEQEKAGLARRLEEAKLQEQRHQVAENVELIRLKRGLAQQAAQLAALEERAQAAEQDHAQARQALAAAQRDTECAQQQRNVLKKRALDLEAELQSVQSERWRLLELEVAVKDLQRERDALQGQNARLLAMAEERAGEAAQGTLLLERLRAVERELAEAKSQAAASQQVPGSPRNSGGGDKDNPLLSQVGRLQAELSHEMRERLQLLQMLERLRDPQITASPPRPGAEQVEGGSEQRPLPPAAAEPERSVDPSQGQEPAHLAADVAVGEDWSRAQPSRSVGCMTEPEGPRLDKCLQVSSSDAQPRVPSLQQSRLAVAWRASRARARVSDELPSEATDADLSLCERSPGEVSSESLCIFAGSTTCKSQGETTDTDERPACLDKSQGEVSSESACEKPRGSQDVMSSAYVSLPSDKFTAVQHLETIAELEKCQDLLRVQCRINFSLEDEVARLRQRAAPAEAGHARQLAELRRQLGERAAPALPPVPRGLFQLHASTMQLCSGAAEAGEGRALFLSWVFCDQEPRCTPPRPARPSVDYDYSAVYQVDVGRSFLDYLRHEECTLELHGLDEAGNSRLEARGALRFSELLQFPRNRLHTSVPLLAPDEGRALVATLHCWYQLALGADTVLPLPPADPAEPSQPAPSSSSAPVPVPRATFPFSPLVTSETGIVPTAAPRSSAQPSGGGTGQGAAAMKRLADSVLGPRISTEECLGQILEEKWRERQLAATNQLVSPVLGLKGAGCRRQARTTRSDVGGPGRWRAETPDWLRS
ncbi:coiled-coil domain-containing protein 88B-like isoform X2 [Bacillus rossius redtenbacheri]|uniref:coiled-coil domain-containing protein 88B-like isoform X2 n=1 Tax=Bacillus rossius redtenbacheri TaxID=93214 RepID=UPI002FDD3CDF